MSTEITKKRQITKFWTYPCNTFLLAHSTIKVLALLPRTAFLNVTLSNPFLAMLVRNILTAASNDNVVQLGLARCRGRLTCATDPYRSFKRLSRRIRFVTLHHTFDTSMIREFGSRSRRLLVIYCVKFVVIAGFGDLTSVGVFFWWFVWILWKFFAFLCNLTSKLMTVGKFRQFLQSRKRLYRQAVFELVKVASRSVIFIYNKKKL